MDDLDLIKQKINIVDLIQEYLPLKKSGIILKPAVLSTRKKPLPLWFPLIGVSGTVLGVKGGVTTLNF